MLPVRKNGEFSATDASIDRIVTRASAHLDSIARISGRSSNAADGRARSISEPKFWADIAPRSDAPPRVRTSRAAPRSSAVHPGSMSWHEFASNDPSRSAAFLAEILDADVFMRASGEPSEYATLVSDGLHIAGGVSADRGARASWNTYLRVPNVDVLCELALANGGSVHVAPSGILGLDRRAMIADPTGAELTIIAGGDDRRTIGAGTLGWDELRSTEPLESVRFWCEIFGWTAVPVAGECGSQSMLFLNGGRAVASIAQALAVESKSRWLPVATVRATALDSAIHLALHAGGSIRIAPHAHAVLQTAAVLIDPIGLEITLGCEPNHRIFAV